MKPAELTKAISNELPTMRRSERKVVEFVLSRPAEVVRMRIVELAIDVAQQKDSDLQDHLQKLQENLSSLRVK